MSQYTVEDIVSLLTKQMSACDGLKQFGEAGANAIKAELQQLLYHKVMHGVKPLTMM